MGEAESENLTGSWVLRRSMLLESTTTLPKEP
jgi:hypothetical protein